jgi:hypothetical protein
MWGFPQTFPTRFGEGPDGVHRLRELLRQHAVGEGKGAQRLLVCAREAVALRRDPALCQLALRGQEAGLSGSQSSSTSTFSEKDWCEGTQGGLKHIDFYAGRYRQIRERKAAGILMSGCY